MKKNAPPREERGRRSSTEANPHPASDRLHRRRRNPLEHKQGANRFQPVRTQTIHEGQFTEPKPSKPLRPLGASHLLESVPHLADDNIHNPLKKKEKIEKQRKLRKHPPRSSSRNNKHLSLSLDCSVTKSRGRLAGSEEHGRRR